MHPKISAAEARRIALAAQGFADRRPGGRIDRRHLARVLDRIGLLQLDSVNVLVRAHYLPLFARLGAYPTELLDRAAWSRQRSLFEYWGHEASLLPLATQPLLRWRMARAARGEGVWREIAKIARDQPALVRRVFDEVARRGPIGASELDGRGARSGPWWGWDESKRALEYLFWSGQLTTATRRGFERIYDLPERVLPKSILDQPTPDEVAAQRQLVQIAARAYGIANEADLRDYFRLRPADARRAIEALVADGALEPVTVEGWRGTAYLDPAARRPRRVTAEALLAPFDPLVWHRARAERLFDFHYRIEIYVPAHKRTHGYYVLPFLMGDRLVARVDLKADRAASVLKLHAAQREDDADPASVADALTQELARMAGWLGLDRVEIGRRGNLASALRRAAR